MNVKRTSALTQNQRPAPIAQPQGASFSKAAKRQTIAEAPSAKNDSKTINAQRARRWSDAGVRGLIRWVEVAAFKDSLWRLPFRFATEIFRYGSTGSLEDLMKNRKVDKKVWGSALRKSLENVIATAVAEPNQIQNRVLRVGVGFLNMVVRIGARFLLSALDIVSPDVLDMEMVGDEFAGRSVLRGIYSPSDNPIVGIGVRVLEQLGINEMLHHTPIAKMFSRTKKCTKVLAETKKDSPKYF